jgi:outer membrane protein assembly factor BamB
VPRSRDATAQFAAAMAAVALSIAFAVGLAGSVSSPGGAHGRTGRLTTAGHPTPPASPASPAAGPATPASAFPLLPASGPGALAPGSDPRVLPADVLIADEDNHRLLLVDPLGRVRWEFPSSPAVPGQDAFGPPDDAFVSPDGRQIVATQEMYDTVSLVSIAGGRVVASYGHPDTPGSAPGFFSHPDDAMLLPDGDLLLADIVNCRIIALSPGPWHVVRQFGTTSSCSHDPPVTFGSPNGVFPMTDGNFLVTEINGDWVDEMSLQGHVSWSAHPPGVAYPSDANEISPNRYLVCDYSSPGQVVIFDNAGRLLWRFRPTGADTLNHPSLAVPLRGGDILVNDDYNDRVIVVDPRTNHIVWQYGHTGVPGQAPGYLSNPDGVDLAPPYSLLMTHAATMGHP